jgi:hypothetical protein
MRQADGRRRVILDKGSLPPAPQRRVLVRT